MYYYPNVNRQDPNLISLLCKAIEINLEKVKNILTKGIKHKNTLAVLRHQGTNYDVLVKPEKLNEFKSHLSDYFTFGEEYLQTVIKNIVNEHLAMQLVTIQAETEERLDEELLLYQYKSFEDSAVESELNILKAAVKQLNELIESIKAENISLGLRVTELEHLTNELLAGSADDKEKIKSLEMSHEELQNVQAIHLYTQQKLEEENKKQSRDIDKLFALADLNNDTIGKQQVQIGEQQVQIGDLNNIIGVQQVQIEVLTTDVKEKTVRIEALEHKVGEQHIVICEQQQEFTEVKIELTEVKIELTEVKIELTEVKTQVSTILENQAKAAAMYEKLLSFEEDLVSMEEGIVITKELKDSLVSKAHALVGDSYSVINNLNYHKAPFDERSQWKKMVDALRSYLQRMSKFGLNPNAQLQMIDKIEKDYYVGYGNAT
jgi:chromosome segregation ATPase